MCLACFAGLETGPSKEARKAPVGWTKERVGVAAGGGAFKTQILEKSKTYQTPQQRN